VATSFPEAVIFGNRGAWVSIHQLAPNPYAKILLPFLHFPVTKEGTDKKKRGKCIKAYVRTSDYKGRDSVGKSSTSKLPAGTGKLSTFQPS